MKPNCVFCDRSRILSEIEDMTASDSSPFMVFEPRDPVTPGHLLVVPVQHVADATENPLVTAMAFGVAARVGMRVGAHNLITSVGVAATQSVWHFHVHVVPRKHHDGLTLPWTPAQRPRARVTW